MGHPGPHFPAPERVLNGVPPQGTAQARLTAAEDGLLEGYTRLEGRLTGDVDGDSPIYVQLGDMLYEASPVGEAGEGGSLHPVRPGGAGPGGHGDFVSV